MNNSNNKPALIASSEYSNSSNTNNTTDDKGDVDEHDDKDDNDDTNRRHPQNANSHTGTISTLTTNNNNNNRRTRDNNADADNDNNDNNTDANAYADNNNTDAITMGNSNVVTQTTQDFEVGDGGASDGEGSIANTPFLMVVGNNGDDNDADKNADADDDVDVHTRPQDAPKDFIPPAAKSALGEPPWSMAANPGLWDQYCFRPKFDRNKEGKYLYHQLPSGCTPVPGEGTKRKRNSLDFYYNGWIPEDNEPAYSRRCVLPSMVESELIFPSERKGLLNMRKLKLHSLTKERLILGDAPFFYQLLLPLHLDPVDEAEEDPLSKRKPFYNVILSDFNYAYKFDYIYKALVHNTRYFTDKAGDDLCMNEPSSWPYYGFDVGKLWKHPPHLTVDNFFNGDSILDWMGERGLGMIGTVTRYKLPKGVPHKYFHKENDGHSAKKIARVAQMCNPVTLVKEVPAKAESGKFTKVYCRAHCSFQSTDSCNLGSVNSLSTNSFFLHRKERGRGNDKRFWAIEMNHAQELHPRTYGKLDQIASSISRANIGYKSWKYYHSAVNHAEALSIAASYDVYKELTDVFRQKLAEQMLHYDPKNQLYPADILLCENTQMSKHQRSRADRRRCCSYTANHGLVLNYHSLETVFEFKGAGSFCFSSIKMGRHLGSFKSTKWHSVRLCYACGKACYYMCAKCKDGKFNIALCPVKDGNRCFQQYHNHRFYGLLKGDVKPRAGCKIRCKGNWNPWNGGGVKGPKEQSSVTVTELTADLMSAVAAV
eukprot:jgi/Psemu1/21713/gm1.21713_g